MARLTLTEKLDITIQIMKPLTFAIVAGLIVAAAFHMLLVDQTAQASQASYDKALSLAKAYAIDRFPSTNRCKVGNMWVNCGSAEATTPPPIVNEALRTTELAVLSEVRDGFSQSAPEVHLDVTETPEICLFVARTGTGNTASVAITSVLKKELKSGKCR